MKEATIYNALQNNFTQVSNEALVNARLSGKAYKLYAYMCYRVSSCPSWIFNRGEILKHFTEGETAMRGAFRELVDSGFLERIRIRNGKGIFEKTDYKIYSTPINKGSNPQVENPPVDNQQVENPRVENQRLNNKDKINKDSKNKDLFFLEETKKHFSDLGYKSDAEAFFDYYQAKGWKIGKDKIVDRASAAKSWERQFKKFNPDLYLPEKPKNGDKNQTNINLIRIAKAGIKSMFYNGNQEDLKNLFENNWDNIEAVDGGFIMKCTNQDAELIRAEYQGILDKFNVKLEIK